MGIRVRRTAEAILYGLVEAHNLRQEESVAAEFHADTTQTTTGDHRNPVVADDLVTATNAVDTATAVALANDLKNVLNRHFADGAAHDAALSAVIATADATDEASAITLANAVKAAFNTHRTAASVHYNNDTNAIAAVDASDAGTLNTLLNEAKADANAHIPSAPPGAQLVLVDP